jgi:hypothetical protein
MGINLHQALIQARNSRLELEQPSGLESWKRLFQRVDQRDAQLEERLRSTQVSGMPQIPDVHRVFTEDDIRSICIKYRLRFLDAQLFKGEIPYEALVQMNALEKAVGQPITGYKVVAPAQLFQLAEKDKDPLLLAAIGDGNYYLVHRWGRDLNPLRAALVYPFRSFETLLATVVGLALFLAILPPDSMVMGPRDTTSFHVRAIFFFYLIFALGGITALYGFSRMKNFSNVLWNSSHTD